MMTVEMVTMFFVFLTILVAVIYHGSNRHPDSMLQRDLKIAHLMNDALIARITKLGMSGGRWFCIDSSDNVQIFDSAFKARDAAEAALRLERDGYDCKGRRAKVEVTCIMWGQDIGREELEYERTKANVSVPGGVTWISA